MPQLMVEGRLICNSGRMGLTQMSKTILTVDDSASMRQMIKLSLKGSGHTLVEAVDGLDGLSKARETQANMVITDLNMPNMNGLGLIRELRKMPAYQGVPIVFLTTESDDAMKNEAKAAGATGWITKPFQAEQLLAVVRKVLG
ncbi:MAG: two-component system chemotaxis family response regulator [Rhodospirillaceae bacterium]|nr:MAG: two-component system chemotaxis family response regulator [Rhodospirillaceae bacterium]TNC96758.1 MAG: two-component system, chemotaxis family, response regulator CheY [Stygiobacter sp.]